MRIPNTTTVRLVRTVVVVVLALALALAATPPGVDAAGTGGITVTPVPAVVDGKPVTAFRAQVPSRGTERVPFTVSNVTDEQRSARIYVAEVTRNDGNFVLGRPGSSPYVKLDPEEVTLEGGEVQDRSFAVLGGDLPDDEKLAAVVVEVQNGAVLQRASTLIYLAPGRQVPLPLVLLVVAIALLATAGVAVALVARRQRRASAEAASSAEG